MDDFNKKFLIENFFYSLWLLDNSETNPGNGIKHYNIISENYIINKYLKRE